MDYSTPGFSVPNYLPEFAQIPIHRVGDAIKPSQLLPLPSLFAFFAFFSFSQDQDLFQ